MKVNTETTTETVPNMQQRQMGRSPDNDSRGGPQATSAMPHIVQA